ncbi:doc_partner, putative addiction module antidote [Fimbriimonadaceae bacterium]
MEKVEVQSVGDALGVIIPPEVLEKLQVGAGDELILTTTAHGFRLTRVDAEFETQLAAATTVMQENREVLRALAD